ncbi:MAG: hypothetical protein B0W54_00575 [Cellvibrio sp. 79]|nr:MAG: hypothetical protein B0W54_00575 [Cellvibrio sp. 79]
MSKIQPKLHAVHHIALICSNYEKSRHFYVDILGLEVLAENYRAVRDSWKLDLALPNGTQLELFSFPQPPVRPSQPEACGLRHLAFVVRDLSTVIDWLGCNHIDVEPVRVDEYTQKRFTFFKDPDGLPLELYELPAISHN